MNPERTKLLRQAAQLRRDLSDYIRMADEAEVISDEIDRPLWRTIIKPYIERNLTAFQAGVYSIPKEEFGEAQAVASALNTLMLYIEGLVGKRRDYLDAAEKIKQKLEQAEREGLIPRSEEE
jgi:hypothetical protein